MNTGYIKMLRPAHWVKNLAVLLPLVFAMEVGNINSVVRILTAAAVFCLLSSGVYIINDLRDRPVDKLHPHKKNRPIASGGVDADYAFITALILITAAFVSSFLFFSRIFIFLAGYFCLQAAYSFSLKRVVLLDVICIAMGFVLRASAGAAAIKVAISPWLFICMFTICLFMGFCKRYNEKVIFADSDDGQKHRDTLLEYTPELLTHLVTLSAGLAVISFISYAMSPLTVGNFGSEKLVYTLPLVVYAVFRFAMVSMKALYEGPTEIILKDRPFQIAAFLWGLWVFTVINWEFIASKIG